MLRLGDLVTVKTENAPGYRDLSPYEGAVGRVVDTRGTQQFKVDSTKAGFVQPIQCEDWFDGIELKI